MGKNAADPAGLSTTRIVKTLSQSPPGSSDAPLEVEHLTPARLAVNAADHATAFG